MPFVSSSPTFDVLEVLDVRIKWWSWTGSNRRPQACKARALPTELQPPSPNDWKIVQETSKEVITNPTGPVSRAQPPSKAQPPLAKRGKFPSQLPATATLTSSESPRQWWAWVDSNHRPPAYQADALTRLSYRPPELIELRFTEDHGGASHSSRERQRASTLRSPKTE